MTSSRDVQLDLAQVGDFLGRARWFGGKGREFAVTGLRRLGTVGAGTAPEVVPLLAEVRYADGGTDLYHLPLSVHTAPQERLEHALVARTADDRWAYDAVHDRVAMAAYLHAFGQQEGFVRLPGHDLDLDATSSPFGGEQSNSSVFFGEDAVLKLFRRITPGENPDVTIHRVLTEAGSTHVAHLYGWIEQHDLHLGMLQQFLRTASDGWEIALASVRDLFAEADLHAEEVGGDFAGEAARLGEALAEIHAELAAAFPTRLGSSATLSRLMADRFESACAIVPALQEHADPVRAVFADVARLDDLATQRIHGDLHLGQTLRTVLGWKVVDFEGEPAKSLAERLVPDSPWRDVAGMIRSFDYAPHAVAASSPEEDPDVLQQRATRAAEWARRNRRAFLASYAGADGIGPAERTLLTAYVIDKAVYECVYEARNRPAWLPIPLAGIARVVAG